MRGHAVVIQTRVPTDGPAIASSRRRRNQDPDGDGRFRGDARRRLRELQAQAHGDLSPSQSRASPAANFPCGSEVTRSSLMSNRGTTQHGRMWMRACTLILPALLTASCMAPTATPAASDRATATPAAITTPPATGPGSPTPASRTFRSATGRWSASMPVAWFSEESSGRAIIRSYDPSQAAFESAPGAAESGPDVPTQRCASSLR